MSAVFFPSINNRIDKSVPKFGARWTINRPVARALVFGAGVGVARDRAFASTTVASVVHKIDIPMNTFAEIFIQALSYFDDFPMRFAFGNGALCSSQGHRLCSLHDG